MLKKLKGLETEAILLAEKDDIDGAIAKFSEAIALCPNYASAYNNRYLSIVPTLRLLTRKGSKYGGGVEARFPFSENSSLFLSLCVVIFL